MDVWTFIWLMFLLKIPVVALFLLVRWAVRQGPIEPALGDDGGTGPKLRPVRPQHPRPRRPRPPRRGPHGEPPPPAPRRVRTLVSRRPLPKR